MRDRALLCCATSRERKREATLFLHRFRLEQAAEAYRLFDTHTTGKGVFLS